MSLLSLVGTFLVAALCAVGVGIGAFYRIKFGEATRSWLLAVGAVVGSIGFGLRASWPVHPLAGDLVVLAGACFLAIGTFWLWFVMMGPRR
jgi:hypothetical protein